MPLCGDEYASGSDLDGAAHDEAALPRVAEEAGAPSGLDCDLFEPAAAVPAGSVTEALLRVGEHLRHCSARAVLGARYAAVVADYDGLLCCGVQAERLLEMHSGSANMKAEALSRMPGAGPSGCARGRAARCCHALWGAVRGRSDEWGARARAFMLWDADMLACVHAHEAIQGVCARAARQAGAPLRHGHTPCGKCRYRSGAHARSLTDVANEL